MKFLISRLELASLLGKLQNVVSAKQTVPVLSNLLIEASNDELVMSATDMTVGLRCYTDTKVVEEGATTLPAKHFANLVRELTAVNIEVICHEGHVTEIVADSSRFKLHGLDHREFPALPDFEGAARFVIKQSVLRRLLHATSFSVAREESRYSLNGLFMRIEGGVVTFVGTDGKRLARAHATLDVDPEFSGEWVIPLKAVDEIVKNLADDENETATVYLLEDRIAVECNQMNLITKLLTSEYPDYNRVIPERSEHVITLHAAELGALLKQIALFTDNETHSVRFTFADGELRLASNSHQVGEGNNSMPANYHGPRLDVAFNPHFFWDILKHTRSEIVTLAISDAYTPGVVTDGDETLESGEQPSPLWVLMPMRLNEA